MVVVTVVYSRYGTVIMLVYFAFAPIWYLIALLGSHFLVFMPKNAVTIAEKGTWFEIGSFINDYSYTLLVH